MVYLDGPCRQYIYVQSESFQSSRWYYHYCNAVWEERLDQIVHKIHFNTFFLSKYPVFQVLSHYCSHNWPCCSKMLKGVFAVFMKKKANDAFSHCFHIFLKRFLMICWKCGISRQILDHIPRPQTPRRNEREKLHRAVKFNLQITQFIQINPFVGEQISKQISSTAFLNKGLST